MSLPHERQAPCPATAEVTSQQDKPLGTSTPIDVRGRSFPQISLPTSLFHKGVLRAKTWLSRRHESASLVRDGRSAAAQ